MRTEGWLMVACFSRFLRTLSFLKSLSLSLFFHEFGTAGTKRSEATGRLTEELRGFYTQEVDITPPPRLSRNTYPSASSPSLQSFFLSITPQHAVLGHSQAFSRTSSLSLHSLPPSTNGPSLFPVACGRRPNCLPH